MSDFLTPKEFFKSPSVDLFKLARIFLYRILFAFACSLAFYKQVYKINDFSLSSVCSANMKETNKEIKKKALQIVKK